MKRIRTISMLTLTGLALSSYAIRADVRADEKTRVELGGVLGRMMNMFGGRAAREGVASSVAVKGDRKATFNDTTGQIVDLGEDRRRGGLDRGRAFDVVRVGPRGDERRRGAHQQHQNQQDLGHLSLRRWKGPQRTPDRGLSPQTVGRDFAVKNAYFAAQPKVEVRL